MMTGESKGFARQQEPKKGVSTTVIGTKCQSRLPRTGAVLVALLRQGVELCDGVVECLLGEVARAVGRVEDLVVENAEVERETEADGVRGRQLCDGDV